MDGVFQQAIRGEVFSKHAYRQLPAGQLILPVVVVRDRVAVNGLIFSAMDAEIRLTVAVQIKASQGDSALDRLLEDPSRYRSPVPHHRSWQSSIHGHYFHIPIILTVCVPVRSQRAGLA